MRLSFSLHEGDAVALVAKFREEIPIDKIYLTLKEVVLNLPHGHEPRLVVERRTNKIQSLYRWPTTYKFSNLLSLFLWNENVEFHMPFLLLEEVLRKTKLLVDADFGAYVKIWKKTIEDGSGREMEFDLAAMMVPCI
eukprot:UN15772